jgi:hypothetical protein
VKLANPEGAFAFELQGPDPWQRPLPPPPALNSEAFAAEMILDQVARSANAAMKAAWYHNGWSTAGVHFRRDEIEGIVLGEWYRGNTPVGLRPDGAG